MTDYKPLNNLAYEYLRSMIYQCEFEFRKIYSETKLAAQIEVSRTPMRDALNRLAQERYIDILPNRGFTLHIPTREDAAAAYHLRLMTESYCAEIVRRDYPENGSRETLEKMEDALRQQQRLLENDDAYSIGHFWLDDLSFVARKGRLTNSQAFFGKLIGIKPLGDIDYNGMTTVIGKAKGERAAYEAILGYIERTIEAPERQIVFVAHSDREKQALVLRDRIQQRIHPKEIIMTDVFRSCGVNVGPGLMAAYYVGRPISEGLAEERALMRELLGK